MIVDWRFLASVRVFAVVDGIHLWFSVPFNMLYPVKATYWQRWDCDRSRGPIYSRLSDRLFTQRLIACNDTSGRASQEDRSMTMALQSATLCSTRLRMV